MVGQNFRAESAGVGPVLLVDDDRDIREAMAELLQAEGYECILARHGAEALELMTQQTPSLLIIDLLMPVMNGVELIARLREDPRWRDLPVIVTTAAGDRIIGVDLETLGVPVLRKPLDVGSLAQALALRTGPTAEPPEARH
jgi:two-component system chemotaxis response regulator CheY